MESDQRSISLYLPSLSVGGAERMMLHLAIGLAGRGYDVDMVLVNAEGGFVDEVPDSVEVVDLNARRVLTSLPGLISYLRKRDPDVLLSTITPTNVVATWATMFPGIDTHHVVRVARPESTAAKVQDNTWKERLTARLARRMYHRADSVVAISEGVATDLREFAGIENVTVIYNPVLTDEVYQLGKESPNHPWFNEDYPIVIGVGRLVDQKDFSTLIEAFAYVHEKSDARLIIFGEGDKRSELEGLIDKYRLREVVDLPGFTDNPYVYMANSDVFVNSAKHEGFGNVIVEAMAFGTTIVATDCPGAPAEILEGGKYGQLVPVGSHESMAEAILNSIKKPTDPANLKNRAKMFDLDKSLDNYEVILFGSN